TATAPTPMTPTPSARRLAASDASASPSPVYSAVFTTRTASPPTAPGMACDQNSPCRYKEPSLPHAKRWPLQRKNKPQMATWEQSTSAVSATAVINQAGEAPSKLLNALCRSMLRTRSHTQSAVVTRRTAGCCIQRSIRLKTDLPEATEGKVQGERQRSRPPK